MELVRIAGPADVRTAELRERAATIPLTKNRRQFVARDAAGDDVAFLSFDLWPGRDFLVLYELWVARVHRGGGVGTAALDAALGIARDTARANPRAAAAGRRRHDRAPAARLVPKARVHAVARATRRAPAIGPLHMNCR